jgi:glycosyltransferase involved in cell wall biosynthesis
MVGLDLNPPWVEGIRNTTYELAVELSKRGHEVHLLSKGYSHHERTEHTRRGITFHRILTKEKSGYLRGFQRFLLELPNAVLEIAKGCGIDVVHAHSSYPGFGWYVGMITSLTNSKKVFSLYSSGIASPTFEYSSIVTRSLKLAKSYKLLRLVNLDAILAHSKRVFNGLFNGGSYGEKLHYVPVGIDTRRFKPQNTDETKLRSELHIGCEAKAVLFAGDLTPCKGVEYFLSCLKKLKDVDKNVVGIILTKGLYELEQKRRQLVEQLISQLNLTENVRLLGIRSDMEAVYCMSDVVVFPFLRDYALMDTPRALLEAMACGKPVVATNVGAVSEVVRNGENGITVEPNSAAVLADAVTFLLRTVEEADRLGKNAARNVLENYGSSSMTKKVEEVYNGL